MAKRRHMPDSHTAHPNVTPLIDIVMCLIIFFMLVAKIGVSTGAEKMDIPESILGADLKGEMSNTLLLNVRGIQGMDQPLVTAQVKNAQGVMTKQELKVVDLATGKHPLAEVLKLYRKGNDKFSVIIRGEADTQYRYLEPVLLACAEANVTSTNFNTKKVTETGE